MTMAIVILIVSAALFIFYLQATCERILRREFSQEFLHAVVNANRLEFPFVRKAIEEFDAPVDYPRFRMQLKCDFLALIYLLKNAGNPRQRFTYEERMLVTYFRAIFLLMILLHALGVSERAVVLRLTSVLGYFANVVGERVNMIRVGNMTASDYLMSL